jgi:hypothetical protein
MKFYESNFDEYVKSVEKYNIHSELTPLYDKIPKNIRDFDNIIMYGPPGTGKYSQILHLLKRYSPSELKYEKKITIKTDKQEYNYHISDIHYEIDMSFLGCNSKILWHEIYFQIVDIVSVKPEKIGIVLCKNFHKIHSELLDIFYSYIQHYNTKITNIQIKFIIMTEHISFIPYNILNVCRVIGVKRPEKYIYDEMIHKNTNNQKQQIFEIESIQEENMSVSTSLSKPSDSIKRIKNIVDSVSLENIINMKEIQSFSLIHDPNELPYDVFNIICNKIIDDMNNIKNHDFLKFRDSLYDILIYNLDATECLLYILTHFIENNKLKHRDISDILQKSYSFLKYYNNNYRPIYHLENMMYYIIAKIYNYS